MYRSWKTCRPSVTRLCSALVAGAAAAAAGLALSGVQAQGPFAVPIAAMTTPPVSLATPPSGSTYTSGASVPLQASVQGDFTQVEFYVNQTLVGTDTAAPYAAVWQAVPGTHSVTAVGRTLSGVPVYSTAAQVSVVDASAGKLVQKGDLVYQGAFRLPAQQLGPSQFAFGGTAMSFSPARGTLFIVGHDWNQRLAEVGIPEIRNAPSAGGLATAPVAQPFGDPTDGKRNQVNPTDPNDIKLGGTLPVEDGLIVSAFSYYDGGSTQSSSHFKSGFDLGTANDTLGPFRMVAGRVGYVSGYMAPVPAGWQAALGGPAFTGNCCLSVISRTSNGPALFTFDPADVGVKNPIPTTALVYYPHENPLRAWNTKNDLFNGTTEVRGVVLPEGTRSVLFFGRHGMGTFCYGAGGATKPPGSQPWCHDPASEYQGTHAYPYEQYVWAYDANELVEVKNGTKRPWEVKPYAVWTLDPPYKGGLGRQINGAAYDPATGRIFLTVAFADEGGRPLVLVYKIAS
ncbi:MAG: hypothetical protein FJW23_03925 [Acidimicrobiia bacterium]|nr:hypothetical protein [Acidimicrobiia bacterium]